MFIALIAVSWCLANLLFALLFITSMGETIALENLPTILLSMIFNVCIVFVIRNLLTKRYKKNKKVIK